MEAILILCYIIFIAFGILQIILFFKVWGMTNDIKAIKNKYVNKVEEESSQQIIENIPIDEEKFPTNSKFKKGDIVLYKPENIKVIVIGYVCSNVFKCKTIEGPIRIYHFREIFLEKIN